MTISAPATSIGSPGMRFAVDSWDPAYGTSLELTDDLGETQVAVSVGVERSESEWKAIDAAPRPLPEAVLFVDGVRRIEAMIWIDEDAAGPTEASLALCASYAAGTVCCCAAGAHLLTAEPRRGLFTVASHAVEVHTTMGSYPITRTTQHPARALTITLSSALQGKLAQIELETAVSARGSLAGHGVGEDLLVIDGPLRGREHLPRALGYIKSHQRAYLPPQLHRMVGLLASDQRTPIFLIGGAWDRHSWYLRLPCPPAAPWSGIVRLECSADLPFTEVIALADLSQAVLPRFASQAFKDSRAPQNLYPIGGLEKELRHRLGDTRILRRALRQAAMT